MIDRAHTLPITRQAELLGMSRGSVYYLPRPTSEADLALMQRMRIDSDRLTQVLTNLLSNAVKFSPPGSTVEVRVSRVAQQVRVEVADHGPGIPEKFRSRIFQKFSQADSSDSRQKGGTGLGLNISKALIEQMGGHIGFNSQVGAGSTFFFELPEWKAPEPLARPDPKL